VAARAAGLEDRLHDVVKGHGVGRVGRNRLRHGDRDAEVALEAGWHIDRQVVAAVGDLSPRVPGQGEKGKAADEERPVEPPHPVHDQEEDGPCRSRHAEPAVGVDQCRVEVARSRQQPAQGRGKHGRRGGEDEYERALALGDVRQPPAPAEPRQEARQFKGGQ
jgi:hypothetical protein